MTTVNIGILAHVDAGKTSLTERLLFDAGSIDRLGSVDAGDTQTDSGDIERQRGITVRTAVAPFLVGDRQVNVIDTPGHPDFIAEVERALAVLDGAVLVVSAVEGVQPQTRVLMKTLRALGLPTLLFVNKIDRTGAQDAALLAHLRRTLSPQVLAVNEVLDVGTRRATTRPRAWDAPAVAAEFAGVLAAPDEGLLARGVERPGAPPPRELQAALRAQTAAGLVHPLYFGSALTGEGVAALVDGVVGLLPTPGERAGDGAVRGTVFAVERAAGGAKVCYVRIRSGALRRSQRVGLYRRAADGTVTEQAARITALEVVRPVGARPAGGPAARSGGPGATAGQPAMNGGDIARVWGLAAARVGDLLGDPADAGGSVPPVSARPFPPPGLESVVVPRTPAQAPRLHAALTALADQDPLIGARTVPGRGTAVLLYGEVQKEVIAATLSRDFGIDAAFEPSRVRCLERPVGRAEAYEGMGDRAETLFWASIGLRVEPGEPGSGVVYRLGVELGSLPLAFHRAIESTVRETLAQGVYGWPVTDCVVTLHRSGFSSVMSTGTDFRRLTPLVLMAALKAAGTRVYEPYHAYELEVPQPDLPAALAVLGSVGAEVAESGPAAATGPAGATEHAGTAGAAAPGGAGRPWCVRGAVPARQVDAVQRRLPGLTGGEGVWWARPSGDGPVSGPVPRCERADGNPLDRAEYVRWLALGER
ncbi:GTP-binding protein [Streptomyces sp. HSW2009]|uniref:GTP-binding protein n=1 Tax=Streptomyces sp. HSW2009 TaxID=3142890 RepID=UPI0032EB8639